MNTRFKKVASISYTFLITVLICIAVLAAMSAFGFPQQYRLFVVQTGSMEPTIMTGSLVVVHPQEDYHERDIITFKTGTKSDLRNPKLTTTHRIVKSETKDGSVAYTTKGDINNTPDLRKVTKNLVVGKVIFSVPYLGYPVGFAKTQTGFILLIVIPATIIVYSELMNIKNEARRLLAERKKRKLSAKEKIEEKIGEEVMNIEEEVKKSVGNI